MSKVVFQNIQRRVPPNRTVVPPTEGTPASFDGSAVVFESNGTTHTFNIQDGLAGDIGLAVIRCEEAPSIPSGWTELTSADSNKTRVVWRRYDGTETDGTFTTAVAGRSVGFAWVVPKGSASSLPDPEASSWASGNGTNIDSPALTVAQSARHLVMSLWFHGNNDYSDSESDLPSGYSFIGFGLDKSTGGFQHVNGAHAFVDVTTSVNPPAWNLVGTNWHAVTVAVRTPDAGASVAPYVHTHVEADVTDLNHTDSTAIHDDVSGEIAAVTEKVSPVSADLLLIEDSAAANAKKRVQVGNLPGGASALDDLTDVTITTPTTGQVVKYNGSVWVNDTDDTGSGSLPTGVAKGDLAVFDGTSWVRVGTGANDTVLTADSAQTAGVKWAAGAGGGGKSYVTFPAMKPPNSAGGIDDEFNQANATNPTSGSWVWRNQGGASAEVRHGALRIVAPSSAGDSLRILEQNAPATPWDVSTIAEFSGAFANPGNAGICMVDSVSGRVLSVHVSHAASQPREVVLVTRWNSTTSFNSNVATSPPSAGTEGRNPRWWGLKVEDDGTDIKVSTSTDRAGYEWFQIYTEGRTAFLTNGCDKVGLFANSIGSQRVGTFWFFRQDWTSDFDPTTDD